MSIAKKFLKTKPVCKVKFSLSGNLYTSVDSIDVVGEFNDWKPGATSMKKSKTGEWSATIDIPAGKPYHFRYLINGTEWENDPEADSFQNGGMGSDNSVIEL